MSAFVELLDLPTPTLWWGRGLLKLELMRPSGGVEDRAVTRLRGPGCVEAGPGGALAAAAWAKANGWKVTIKPRGLFTHEVRKSLELYGAALDPEGVPTLHALNNPEAYASLVAELAKNSVQNFVRIVGPAGAWPALRACRGSHAVVCPELPDGAQEDPSFEAIHVTKAQAAEARKRLARETGVLASHLSAAAAWDVHENGGLALVTSAGEREFSLE